MHEEFIAEEFMFGDPEAEEAEETAEDEGLEDEDADEDPGEDEEDL